MPASKSFDDRFFEKVHFTDGCWLWTACTNNYGYPQIGSPSKPRRMLYAHRVAYERIVGPIPEGMELDHLCRTPRCIRPDHLEPVSHRENILRGQNPAARHVLQTHCCRGHEYTPENTYRRPDQKGRSRACRTCAREQRRQRAS